MFKIKKLITLASSYSQAQAQAKYNQVLGFTLLSLYIPGAPIVYELWFLVAFVLCRRQALDRIGRSVLDFVMYLFASPFGCKGWDLLIYFLMALFWRHILNPESWGDHFNQIICAFALLAPLSSEHSYFLSTLLLQCFTVFICQTC